MKKLLFSLAMSAVMLLPFACSNKSEQGLPSPQKQTASTRTDKSAAILGTDAHAFVSNFYNTSYTVGQQVTTRNGSDTYIVSEITVGSDTRARGYMVTNQANNAPLYFADVDRLNYTTTSIDISQNEQIIAYNIDQNPEYSLTGGFDFISIITDPIETPADGGISRRPFWGWDDWYYGACNGFGYRNAYRVHYVMGIKHVKITKEVGCEETLSSGDKDGRRIPIQ